MNHNLFSSLSDWGGGCDVPVVQPDRAGDLRRRRVRRAAPGGEEQGQEGVQGARKGISRVSEPPCSVIHWVDQSPNQTSITWTMKAA